MNPIFERFENLGQKYEAIARKYRPQLFADVLGQEAIVTTLKNALTGNRVAHAYLFCGSRGTGKTTLARVFAKGLNCDGITPEGEPCNECPSCLGLMSSASIDVLEIDGASNRGIDDIRQINETIGYAPASGKYKVYIVDEVHMLTREAFNALLKTLEEPPPKVKFLFATTEPHKIPQTILSRCQRFDLNRISIPLLSQKLKVIAQDLNICCEEEVFTLLAHVSEGSLRDAESLFDQLICYANQSHQNPITAAQASAAIGFSSHQVFTELDQAFGEQNLNFAFELADQLFLSGKDFTHFLDMLIEHYRILLKCKMGLPISSWDPLQKQKAISSASLYTQEQCLYILDYLVRWQQEMTKTLFKQVTLEMILLHLIRSKYRVTFPAIVKKLHEISLPKTEQEQSLKTVLTPLQEDPPIQVEPSMTAEEKFSSPSPLETSENSAQPVSSSSNRSPSSRHETLMRFASVELEGTLYRT